MTSLIYSRQHHIPKQDYKHEQKVPCCLLDLLETFITVFVNGSTLS